MDISPIEFVAAFFAACIVLAIARVTNGRSLPQQYSLGALMIAMTFICAVLGLISIAIQK